MSEENKVTADAVIKGEGFNYNGGGFATIIINGARYHPDQVAAAVNGLGEVEAMRKAAAPIAELVQYFTGSDEDTVAVSAGEIRALAAALSRGEG